MLKTLEVDYKLLFQLLWIISYNGFNCFFIISYNGSFCIISWNKHCLAFFSLTLYTFRYFHELAIIWYSYPRNYPFYLLWKGAWCSDLFAILDHSNCLGKWAQHSISFHPNGSFFIISRNGHEVVVRVRGILPIVFVNEHNVDIPLWSF